MGSCVQREGAHGTIDRHAEGLSLGFLGAVLFRDFPFWIEFAFFLAAGITFAGAWFIAGAEDDR